MSLTQDIKDFIALRFPSYGPGREMFAEAEVRFRAKGINTKQEILPVYEQLGRDEKFVAILFLASNPCSEVITLLFHELHSTDSVLRGAASASLATIGGDAVLNRLLVMLDSGVPEPVRIAVISTLIHIRNIKSGENLAATLIIILENAEELDQCRADAAEGLANALRECDRRRHLYRRAISVLINSLNDRSPPVRAGASFALGKLRERKALSSLQSVARRDHALCPGLGTVSSVAREAIRNINS